MIPRGFLVPVAAVTLLLTACAGWTPSQPAAEPGAAQSGAQNPANQDSAGVQVFPLQNPAVKELLADASSAESVGDYDKAAVLLERALANRAARPGNPAKHGRGPTAKWRLRTGAEFRGEVL